jgi:hypothetical protein
MSAIWAEIVDTLAYTWPVIAAVVVLLGALVLWGMHQ